MRRLVELTTKTTINREKNHTVRKLQNAQTKSIKLASTLRYHRGEREKKERKWCARPARSVGEAERREKSI